MARDIRESVWTRTLICGDQAVVVTVNEHHECEQNGFSLTPAGTVFLTLLPEGRAKQVERQKRG